ncbi:MAG: lipoyl synthase [Bacteroidales bacterium]|nr:lipoyl synthase [Bacteroidales bacterium]MCF8389265.1 lipoyl synthase [Bacteroidales bacterium]
MSRRLPDWMKVPLPDGVKYAKVKALTEGKHLNTICISGNCPNKAECWSKGTATFMILGEKCTRNCGFCQVKTMKPDPVDPEEAHILAGAISEMGLKHAVITSVCRDDIADGGASVWANTIKVVKEKNPGLTMEVLIPDFRGNLKDMDKVIHEKPEVISHNLETVRRLTPGLRSVASYEQSLGVLRYLVASGVNTKTGIMVGLGESEEEVKETMRDARAAGVNIFTIGQYLQPGPKHHPIIEFVKPAVFHAYKRYGKEIGFDHIESSPLVRSSYNAEKHIHIQK